jgi:aryl-alcohol dehydrogenase-like predicted oxidoreductase
MIYHELGNTSLMVSHIALGTVSLGVDYGIKAPGEYGRPKDADAVHLIQHAANAGINLFDTAPAYGESEAYLGNALRSRQNVCIATKISISNDSNGNAMRGKNLCRAIHDSLKNSSINLQKSVLDIIQIHNATVDIIEQGEVAECLLDAQRKGSIRYIGASVYTEEEALAVIKAGCFNTLQVAYNLLDQRMARKVFSAAEKAGVGIITRSAFLKGALTSKAQWLPPELADLIEAVERAKNELANGSWQALSDIAFRFCLSAPQVAAVLVGVRTVDELNLALKVAEAGPLPEKVISKILDMGLTDEHLLNPLFWPQSATELERSN